MKVRGLVIKAMLAAMVAGVFAQGVVATEWKGSFTNGLNDWAVMNYKNIAALSVEEFKGETAFVVRHSGTNATSGTAWELHGPRFAVKPNERLNHRRSRQA